MVKEWVLIGGLALFSLISKGQATEGKVKMGKSEEPAIIMTYNYPELIVNNAFAAKFADKQLVTGENKDFTFFPNAILPEISKSKLDYYFKIQPNGKEKATVFMVMRGSGDIEGINELSNRSKAFLQGMEVDVLRSHTISEIKKQENILIDEERALTNLEIAQQELEAKIVENKAKQEAQQKIIASQKAILEDLKARMN